MLINVVQAMEEYGDIGFDCFEVPDFYDDEPMLVFYSMALLQDDVVIESLEKIRDVLDNSAKEMSWNDGLMKADCSYLFCQGHDAMFLTISTIDERGEWPCVVQSILCIDDYLSDLSFRDMFEATCDELELNGIIQKRLAL